jgi:NodT family efflux transporter outer membrane factor (OMF) lipoprotein
MNQSSKGKRMDAGRGRPPFLSEAARRAWTETRRSLSLLRTAGVLTIFLIILACTVGPNYVRPPAEVPAAYKEMDGWKVAEPKDHLVRGAWWEIFNDPELNGLEEQVNISNQNVAVAEAQFRQARALVQAARAGYFPTATIGASFTRSLGSSSFSGSTSSTRSGTSSKPPAKSSGTSTSTSPHSDFLLPASVSWEPDLWGRIRRTVEASRASAQASAADLEGVRLLIQAELAQDYLLLRTLDGERQLLDQTVEAFQKSLELTKNRYAGGVASRVEVLQAEAQLKSTQAQAIDVGVQRAQLEHAIALLVGKPASVFSIPVRPLTTVPPAVPVGLPSELLERRPDIAAAERRMAAANAQIGVAVAAYYPTVTLSASGGFEASSLSKWLTWPSRFWSVGAAISETVFDGGLRRAQTDQARAVYDENVASYRETVLTGFQEVEDNLASLRILAEEARVQDEAVKAAKQSVTLTTNQYKAGTVSYLAVIVTQAIALNNERTAIDILGRRMNAGVLLVKALGGGWNASALPSADELDRKDDKHVPPIGDKAAPVDQGGPAD